MKKALIVFLIMYCGIIFSTEEELLFEFYWYEKLSKVHFAALSEDKYLWISQEDHEKYVNFRQQCLEKEFGSLLLYPNRKKTKYFCLDDEQLLEKAVKQERADYEKKLASLAEYIKSGQSVKVEKVGEVNGDATIGLVKPCLEWDAKSSLLIGYAIQSHLAQEKNGIFEIEGCAVKILHFKDGVVDDSKN